LVALDLALKNITIFSKGWKCQRGDEFKNL